MEEDESKSIISDTEENQLKVFVTERRKWVESEREREREREREGERAAKLADRVRQQLHSTEVFGTPLQSFLLLHGNTQLKTRGC
ncbi:hypothetical protein JOB18_040227 [Solea senegalensis]|uniref:Uncharacterized protein n=1 Tax=Solea senegalensis TaxID=28829 RepID=A0AAV6RMS1_SOLSE|nr:hypothetical protein JOB18_040227 [Solea senegalensis]